MVILGLFQAISQNAILRHPTGFPRSDDKYQTFHNSSKLQCSGAVNCGMINLHESFIVSLGI